MDYQKITEQYYSQWLGEDNIISKQGVVFFYSTERNRIQDGYPSQYDIWIWIQPNKIIVSYGEKAKSKIELLRKECSEDMSVNSLIYSLRNIYNGHISHGIKYILKKEPDEFCNAVILREENFCDYLAFFKKNNPNCNDIDWLSDYFYAMVKTKCCCGVYNENSLVCCTDLPGMPYMNGCVQELGINTLLEYRGKGYATDACSLSIYQIINGGKCPQWSTSIENIASQKLAERLGFMKLADNLTVSIIN